MKKPLHILAVVLSVFLFSSCSLNPSVDPDSKPEVEVSSDSVFEHSSIDNSEGGISDMLSNDSQPASLSSKSSSTETVSEAISKSSDQISKGSSSSNSLTSSSEPENSYSTIFYKNGGFYDDFIGGINPALWYIGKTQWGGVGINGGVIPDNVSYTNDGILILTANGDYYEGPIRGLDSNGLRKGNGKRTGATIITNRPLGPGSYEVRMKVVPRLGTCTAIWTYYSDGVRNHEIDIEIPGNKTTFNKSLFSNWIADGDGRSVSKVPASPNNDGEWHTYRFDWHTNPKRVDYYVDGVMQFSDNTKVPTVKGFFWIGVWFPKEWCGNPDFDTAFMLVDWVKYSPYNETGWEENNRPFTQQAPLSDYPIAPAKLPLINYISNGGFEFNSQAFVISDAASAAIKPDVGILNTYGAKINGSGTMSQIISAINENMQYSISGNAFIQGGGTAIIKIECLDLQDIPIVNGSFLLNFTESYFISKSMKFTAVPNTGKIKVSLIVSGSGTAYFDNLAVVVSK